MKYNQFKNEFHSGCISIYNGDCMDLLRQTPNKYYDLCIVDPPYGININVSIGRRKGDKKSNYHKFAGEDNGIPNEEYFKELFRVSKNQIIWGGNYMTDFLYPSSCWLLWDKGFSEDVTFAQFEMAWTSFKSSCKKFDYNAAKNIDRIHPTQKPVQLYKWILNKYAKEGDTILDSHLGSGSSAIAAHDGGFEFTGIELDEEYYNAAKERIMLHQRQLNLF